MQAGNVRSATRANAPIVRLVPRDTPVKVFARDAGWLQVGQDEAWGSIYSGPVKAIP